MSSPDAPLPDSSSFLPLMLTLSVPARSVIINPFAQTVLVFPGAYLVPDDDAKRGLPPASKDSINALETVTIGQSSEVFDDHCAVCLEDWEVGDVARVMPCKHKFHGDCIEKWLGVHGSCPVCRFQMPLEEEDGDGKKREEEGRSRGSSVLVFSISLGRILGGTDGDGGTNDEHSAGASREEAIPPASAPTEQD